MEDVDDRQRVADICLSVSPMLILLSSTFVCFCLSDWSHGSRSFTGLICSSVLCFSSIFFSSSYS